MVDRKKYSEILRKEQRGYEDVRRFIEEGSVSESLGGFVTGLLSIQSNLAIGNLYLGSGEASEAASNFSRARELLSGISKAYAKSRSSLVNHATEVYSQLVQKLNFSGVRP